MPKRPYPESVALPYLPTAPVRRPLSRLARWLSGCPLLWALETWLRWKVGLLPPDYLDAARALALTQIVRSRAASAPGPPSGAAQSR